MRAGSEDRDSLMPPCTWLLRSMGSPFARIVHRLTNVGTGQSEVTAFCCWA